MRRAEMMLVTALYAVLSAKCTPDCREKTKSVRLRNQAGADIIAEDH